MLFIMNNIKASILTKDFMCWGLSNAITLSLQLNAICCVTPSICGMCLAVSRLKYFKC